MWLHKLFVSLISSVNQWSLASIYFNSNSPLPTWDVVKEETLFSANNAAVM